MEGAPPVKTRRASVRWQTKHGLILKAALTDFRENGLAGANMDRIAAEAQVSKVTIYNHFSSKLQLFRATIDFYAEKIHVELPRITLEKGKGIREILADYGTRLVAALASEEALAVIRLIESEKAAGEGDVSSAWQAKVWPQLGSFTEFLQHEDRTGRLRIESPEVAALFFHGLILGSFVYPRVILAAPSRLLPPQELDSAKAINAAVNIFVLGHSPG